MTTDPNMRVRGREEREQPLRELRENLAPSAN
jgi:hypothetical protein